MVAYERSINALSDEVGRVLKDIPALSDYLLPSEIDAALTKLAISVDSRHLMMQFVQHTVYKEEFSVFTIESKRTTGKTVLILDGVHTNEMLGGLATVELFKQIALRPEIMNELNVARFVYYHQNPQEMELNEVGLMRGEMNIRSYLSGAYRSAKNVDWGYVAGQDGGAQFTESQNAIFLMRKYQPDFLFPLHNIAAASGSCIHTGGNVADEVIQRLAYFIKQSTGSGVIEGDMDAAQELAPGVYNTSNERMLVNNEQRISSGQYLQLIDEHAQYAAIEVPYFINIMQCQGEASGDDVSRIVQLAEVVEEHITQWKNKWGDETGGYVDKVTASIGQYHQQSLSERLADLRHFNHGMMEYRLRLLFFPAFILGHARRGAQELLSDDSRTDAIQLIEFIEKTQKIIDDVANELEQYLEPLDKTLLVKTYLGVMLQMVVGNGTPKKRA